MTQLPAHSGVRRGGPWLLLALTVALTALGGMLLLPAVRADDTARPKGAGHSAAANGGSNDAPGGRRAPRGLRSSAPPARTAPAVKSAAAVELPPRGEGRAGDRPIQEVLERSWPADLPKRQAADLVTVGRAVLIADVTGVGRDRFPTAFPARGGPVVAPAFSRVRIQAAIARKDTTAKGRAVVHLVWAGADRGGTYTDGRLADLTFRHRQGDAAWTPLPPTSR
ncbi:hypothetical protein [Streptomyces sp. NPDC059262]|uniref:hypothetical protein n=1 Tax=Streptomyces sp. NPDC059262 TaxID=3346797 RepID=UPI003678B49C